MEYTIKKLAHLAGISTRTLRYYDEIDLLKPKRINSSGYRIYGREELNKLQQILFYRELDINLFVIKEIFESDNFNYKDALLEHKNKLLIKRKQLDTLIKNVQNSIDEMEGKREMSDNEKFEGFKQKMIDENERKYGKEIREKYGEDTIDKSNAKLMNMSEEDYKKVTALETKVIETLLDAFKTGDPSSELAIRAAIVHKEWLCYFWPTYSKEAHRGLGDMYVADERFRAYYDKHHEGLAEFLRDAIYEFTKE